MRFPLSVALALFTLASTAIADRPACYKLLPSKTLAYIRIADLDELGEKFNEMSVGRMFQEEELKSLTEHLFEEAETAFTPAGEQVGLSLSEILAIPQGELAFAFVTPPNGFPAPVLMVDIDGQEAAVLKLTDALEDAIKRDGKLRKSDQAVRGTKLTVFSQDEDPRYTGVIHFQRDSMLVMTSNMEVAEQILAAWDGDDEQAVLEDNDDFADVMRHSKGPREAAPQIRWFIDPISFAKVALRGNVGAQMGLGMLPVVGLDGLLALGGSVTMASDEYDTFMQFHIITAEPRTGALAALAMKSGDPNPEKWVPSDAASYTTLYWDLNRTKMEVEVLYDSFRGEDMFQKEVLDRISQEMGVDFQEQIVGAMAGRATLATWYPKPTRINGVAMLGGIELNEDAEFEETLAQLVERNNDVQQKSYGGKTIYFAPSDENEGDDEEADIFKPVSNQLAISIVDDYLLIANRPEHIERAIITQGTSGKKLADELDFKLVYSKARRQPGGRSPGMFSFQRPEEGLRMAYDLATADSTRQSMANADNEFLSRLGSHLDETPLPPFERLRKHFAPNGSIMTADDKGFHYIGFGLRRK